MLWEDVAIDSEEFRVAFEQERVRRQQAEGNAFDPRAFETVANKRQVLDRLVDQRVLRIAAGRANIEVGDDQVRDTIRSLQAFQVDGRFDPQQYQLVLASQVPAMTPRAFEQEVRTGLVDTMIVDAVVDFGELRREIIQRLTLAEGKDRSFSDRRHGVPPV